MLSLVIAALVVYYSSGWLSVIRFNYSAVFDDGFSSDCVIFADYSDYHSIAKVDCSLMLNACEL